MDTYPVRSKNAIDDIVLTRYYAYLGVICHTSVAQFQNKYREKDACKKMQTRLNKIMAVPAYGLECWIQY